MTIWTATLLICWLEGGAIDCHTWTGGGWATSALCRREIAQVLVQSRPRWAHWRCNRTVYI